METWRVNSYSYPNPFAGTRATEAWDVFESFLHEPSYVAVKKRWADDPGRPIDYHTVESWKANFEECGLLYVPAREDNVQLTPAGLQLADAAHKQRSEDFAWVGLNLMLRYPLSGTAGRRGRGEPHASSNVLPYWLVHAATLDLGGLWQSELQSVLCAVFQHADAAPAVERIREIRAGSRPLPAADIAPATYNAINQVAVKAGLNHMVFTSVKHDSPYNEGAKENYWHFRSEFIPLVELALGGSAGTSLPVGCASQATWLDRMPAAPSYDLEEEYFEYLGALVDDLDSSRSALASNTPPSAELGGDHVFVLTQGVHYSSPAADQIRGSVSVLCVLSLGQRVLLSHDTFYTYRVVSKKLADNAEVLVRLKRARRLINPGILFSPPEGADGD